MVLNVTMDQSFLGSLLREEEVEPPRSLDAGSPAASERRARGGSHRTTSPRLSARRQYVDSSTRAPSAGIG
jgi:hypothetical protein